jgi:amino acid adenylation domain-containing protein
MQTCSCKADTGLGTWWYKHCRRGEEVCVYSLPRDVDADRLRSACQQILDELLEGTTKNSSQRQDSSPSSRWTIGNDATYQVLRSLTPHVPVWFGLSKPQAARLEGTFVIATDCMWYSPRELEIAVWSRLDHHCNVNPSTKFPSFAKALPLEQPVVYQPTTSMLAEFGIDLAPCTTTQETKAIIAAAWAFAVSRLYRRSDVSIEFLNAAGNDASFINDHRIELDLSPCRQGGGRRILDGLLENAKAAPTLRSESTQNLPVPDPNQTAIKEHALNAGTAPGGLRLLSRRTYYPYDTVLEWETLKGKLRFHCLWDSNAYNEIKVKTCMNDFRQEFRNLHSLLEHESQRSFEPDAKRSDSGYATPLEVASGVQFAEILPAVDTVTDHDPYEISASDKKIMLEFNSREIPVATQTIPQLVSDQCARQPEEIAVASWDQDLTYKALDDLSIALAAHLRKTLGTQPTAILTMFSKSALGVVVLLAVLRSGHYYIPVDPAHPLSRKRTVYEQARCLAILSSSKSEKICEALDPALDMAITWEFLQKLPSPNDEISDASSIDGRCVVLFTSGSTGKPKGVLLKHRAISTSLQDHGAYIGVDSSSRMLSFASYAFDAHLWDTWTCLIYGGTVCIPNESERIDDLQGFINRARVNVGILMPAALQYLEPDAMPHFKILGVGGEAVTKSHLGPWETSSTKVVEMYGPTECSVISSVNMQLSPDDPSDIGRPVGGAIWITDPTDVNRLLPCGTEGELVVTGHHLADGYLDEVAKTEAAFVTPTWPDWVPGDRRAYRTGDLAVLDSAGTLRIRGRMDGQIKISGLRIERAELEHHIASCEKHGSLPVIEKVEMAPGNHRLVCFFVPSGFSAPFCAVLPPNEELTMIEVAIREHLAREVPAGWIPSTFVFLTKMPLNTSDKIDRQYLVRLYKDSKPPSSLQSRTSPPIDGPEPCLMESVFDAFSETNVLFREAWSQVLGVDASHISDDSNFVRLGGSSINAIKLVAVLRKQGLDINTSQVLAHPVLREQVRLVHSNQPSDTKPQQTRARTPEPFELL